MEELITDEQVLALTNNQKRAEFLKTWPEWPVLAEIPILKLTVRQIVLPNRKRIVSLEYERISTIYRHCYYQELDLGKGINPFNDTSDNCIIESLKDLRMEIVKRKKADS